MKDGIYKTRKGVKVEIEIIEELTCAGPIEIAKCNWQENGQNIERFVFLHEIKNSLDAFEEKRGITYL